LRRWSGGAVPAGGADPAPPAGAPSRLIYLAICRPRRAGWPPPMPAAL